MAVYDPKTKRYVNQGSVSARPKKNYNFKLGVDEFNKKYLSYRYSPDEFKTLAQSGYVGSFGDGALGFKAPAYAVKNALKDVRKGNAPVPFTLPQDYMGSNIVPLASTPNPTDEEMGAWYARAKDFNLEKYIRQYGHAPSETSVYYQIFNPSKAIGKNLENRREDGLEAYQKERDKAKRYQLLQLARATSDPNITALANTLPIFDEWTPGDRRKADDVLRDFGLTGLGAATIPFDVGSKYMLPVNNNAGTTGASQGGTIAESEKSGAETAAIFGASPILGALSRTASLTNLVSSPDSPLAPTAAENINPVSFVGNFVKGIARAGLGFPMGVAEMIANPIDTTKAIVKDYEYRYGSLWGNEDSQFVASTLEDPLAPLLDILGLVPILGAGVKGAQVGKIAATTTRGRGLASFVDETDAVQRAVNILDESERVGGVWAESGAGIMEARRTLSEATQRAAKAAEEYRAGEAERVAAGGAASRGGLSPFQFARIQRAALNNDLRAEIALGEYSSTGYMGLNSGYAPSFLDRAAAFFEPRWSYYNQQLIQPEGAPKIERIRKDENGEDIPEPTPRSETIEGLAPIRFAGSPIARAAQKGMFFVQKGVAAKAIDPNASTGVQRIAGVMANLPLTGFQYRYGKALKTDVNGVGTLVQREMFTHKVFEDLIDVEGKRTDGPPISSAEQLAIMSQVSGKLYSPQMFRSIILRNLALEDERPGTLTEGVKDLLDARLAELDTPEFIDAYIQATAEMMERSTPRGIRLAEARTNFRRKMDLIHHEAGIELGDDAIRAQTRIYAPLINALGLEPESIATAMNNIVTSSGKRGANRVAKFNINLGIFDTLEKFDIPATSKGLTLLERITRGEFDKVMFDVVDEGQQRTLSRGELRRAYQDLMKTFEDSLDIMKDEPSFRSKGNAPFFIVDRVERTIFGTSVVKGRIANIRGEYTDPTKAARSDIFGSEELTLPMEIFQRKSGRPKPDQDLADTIQYYKTKKDKESGLFVPDEEFALELDRAVVNFSMKQFPDARDFSDKVGIETFAGPEDFKQRRNEGVIASSGFLDYHLETQFAAHRNAVNRRFNKDIQQTLENAAVPMTIAQFAIARDQYSALSTMRLHSDKRTAENYASDTKLSGLSEPGEVVPVLVNGVEMFQTRLRFADATKEAMQETRLKQLIPSEEWVDKIITKYEDLDLKDPNAIIMVTPKRLVDDLTKSYERSRALSNKIFSGSTDLFKLAALSLNPRFVSQQVFGGAVMLMLAHPQQAPHVMARFMQYGYRNMSRSVKSKFGREIDDSFVNHGDDYDIFMNKFIRDFEDNIYMQDAQTSFLTKFGENAGRVSNAAVEALHIGYTIAFALEKNLRVAIMREAAKDFPNFKNFLDSPDVAIRAQQGMPEMGYPTISKFNAAVDMLSDRSSPHYNPMFLREIRHTADMVSGNYRDFTTTERFVRNALIPFYAWTRHSAMFTKRLVQERPLTANAVYNVGNYGYEQIFERGGMPDWLLESVPLPDFVENALGLDPKRDNRIGFGSLNPFGTTANSITAAGNIALGGNLAGPNSVFQFTNPYINMFVEQQTGKSLLTGAPIPTAGKGMLPGLGELVGGLPPARIIRNSYKSYAELNELRGREDPMDVFRDPNDPESKLRIPDPKLSTKFPTFTPVGLFNTFAPSSVYSIDPKQLGESIDREFEARGLEYRKNEVDRRKGAYRTINALLKWKKTKEYVENVWLPAFGEQDPALTSRVLAQVQAEYPNIPKTFPQSMVSDVLSGRLTLPEITNAITVDASKPIRQAPRVEVIDPDPVNISRMASHNPDDTYERPAGTPNTSKDVSFDSNGYVRVNDRVAVDEDGNRIRFLVDDEGNLILDERGLPIPVEDDARAKAEFWSQYNPGGSLGPGVPNAYYMEPWTISRSDWADGGAITPLNRGG
jgi:hypothetical protein